MLYYKTTLNILIYSSVADRHIYLIINLNFLHLIVLPTHI